MTELDFFLYTLWPFIGNDEDVPETEIIESEDE